MNARMYKFTTLNTTNLRQVSDGPAAVYGGSFVNTTADAYYVKLYWFKPTASAAAPTVGTTVPDVTIQVPSFDEAAGIGGNLPVAFPFGLMQNSGQLYIAVTGAAGDSDTTAVAAGQGVITLFLQ